MSTPRSALVIGAGIAGPACAIALARLGIRSTIVESHPGPADGVGAIITLASNGVDVLRTLGISEGVTAVSQLTSEVQMSDAEGHPFARHPGGGQVLARDALARILVDQAAAIGSDVQYGLRLERIQPSSQGVLARFVDGSAVEADFLIGADGIHSTVRELIDSDAPRPVYEGILGFGAVTDGGNVAAELGVMNFAFGHRFLGYWRRPDGRICWYAALPHEKELDWDQVAAIPASEWLSRLRTDYLGHVPAEELLARTAPDQLVATGPSLRMPPLPHWFSDRTVLVGDSAHGPTSSSGQGASLALESALELVRCVRDISDLTTAFATYETLRRPRVEAIAAIAAATNRNKAGHTNDAPADRFDPTNHHIDFDTTVSPRPEP